VRSVQFDACFGVASHRICVMVTDMCFMLVFRGFFSLRVDSRIYERLILRAEVMGLRCVEVMEFK